MGTDIHMIGEKRWSYGGQGEWKMFPVPGQFQQRHYAFFAHLADVRNGYGFAGIKTHEPLRPITRNRGLPKDIGKLARNWFNYGVGNDDLYDVVGAPGDHSNGYATLEELKAHDWSQGGSCHGILDNQQYLKWDGVSEPDDWCANIIGPGIKIRNECDRSLDPDTTHVKVHWTQRYLHPKFPERFIQFLEYEADGDDCRILFNFDS